MKICSKCQAEKELSEFPKRKDSPDGYRTTCKTCKNEVHREWVDKNRDHVNLKQKEYDRKYLEKNHEKLKERWREYAKNNRKQKSEQYKRWRHNNPEKAQAASDRHKEYRKEWVSNNRNLMNQWRREWRSRNPGKSRENSYKYYQSIQQATPKWLTEEQKQEITSIYNSAATLQEFHEILYHVDHIEPINGKISCGLHVPWNLQAIPAKENMSKSNKLLL